MIEDDRDSDDFCEVFVKASVICSVKGVPWSLETVESIPPRRMSFPFSL